MACDNQILFKGDIEAIKLAFLERIDMHLSRTRIWKHIPIKIYSELSITTAFGIDMDDYYEDIEWVNGVPYLTYIQKVFTT